MSAAAQTRSLLKARLREHTNGYTVTPAQYATVALVALISLTVIVLTGAAVRLTGSGLGCPTWPKCYGNVYPPLNTHAVIEFSNRVITFPVSIAAGAAWLLALRRRPYRRDLAWLGGLLPLGVVGQAVLGGFTVKGALDYGWVMGHFALSMLILLAAVILLWRAKEDTATEASGAAPEPKAAAVEETATPEGAFVRALWALVVLGAVTIFAGTAATAAGPHAGGSPGQKINRLDFDGRGTMDFVIHRHAEIALVFSLAAVAVWWLGRRRGVARSVEQPLTVLCVLLALQGIVGLDQYETHLPTQLVWVHVALASCAWVATLWAACAAGALAPRRAAQRARRRADGSLRAVAPVEFPGN
jgi:cytochrome c oxidase assembly protein subunit 15